MMAGIAAAGNGHEVHLLEKNEKLGKKLFITGKGRCNLTNACDRDELMKQITGNARFLYSAFSRLDNQRTMELFEQMGLRLKTERGQRVFPASDHSSDVIRVLKEELLRLGVQIHYHSEAAAILLRDGRVAGVRLKNTELPFYGDACIVATGGLSYESTGSTGDGYRFAKEAGHTITPLSPSLVAVEVKEPFAGELMGVSLKNVGLTLSGEKKIFYQGLGEMLFTHFGVSGPLVLSASSYIAEECRREHPLPTLYLDFKPGLTEEQLDQRLQRDFEAEKNRQYRNALNHLLPQRAAEVMVRLSKIDPERQVNAVTREERRQLVSLLKRLPMHVSGLRSYKEAVITKGGVSVKEVCPATMESKLVPGLYFAGEVLDVDAMTGGFNLQIAWSTGYTAGSAVQ